MTYAGRFRIALFGVAAIAAWAGENLGRSGRR